LHTQVVLDALNMALWQRQPGDVIHHSDHVANRVVVGISDRPHREGRTPASRHRLPNSIEVYCEPAPDSKLKTSPGFGRGFFMEECGTGTAV
jgi:hypothetical protein